MVHPKRAPVRPRVILESGETRPLEDEFAEGLASSRRCAIRLAGQSGSGKSTALAHLAELFAVRAVLFLDNPGAAELFRWCWKTSIIYTSETCNENLPNARSYRLASWRCDEFIEYLLATHPDRSGSVISRLPGEENREWSCLDARIAVVVLEQLAAREDVTGVSDALLRHFEEQFPDAAVRTRARQMALQWLLTGPAPEAKAVEPEMDATLARLLVRRSYQFLLAAEHIIADLEEGKRCDYFKSPVPRDLVERTAGELRKRSDVCAILTGWFGVGDEHQNMAASLLHAADREWRPPEVERLHFVGAYRDQVVWPEVRLRGVQARFVELGRADLRKADFYGANLIAADLRQADLRGACLWLADARNANLAGARMSQAHVGAVNFIDANLEEATLPEANVQSTSFLGAKLTGASFERTDLRHAKLTEVNLLGADFTGADLEEVKLCSLKLSEASFRRARFAKADLRSADPECMELPQADFGEAILNRVLSTGSVMRGACFDRACLYDAGLAGIDREGASLRLADLRSASFHAGSTRSGLVASPIAWEGSRTGFYTDDYNERSYLAPEEIRKANLCHADIRGANIKGVDFYLVDLRQALYDPDQEPQLRRTGANLHDRHE